MRVISRIRELGPTVLVALAVQLQVVHRPTEIAQRGHDLVRLADRHVGVELAVHHQQRDVDVLGARAAVRWPRAGRASRSGSPYLLTAAAAIHGSVSR